ncbi:MAG: phosphotransferase, partial [Planctomycetes bacterium]|nr:phosphotransferase [Planctomycetota bacterium]
DFLADQGLTEPAHFLALPGVVVSGHPDRHVVRVTLGALTGFLKREHRLPWRDRLVNALAGFGFVSRSRREAHLLRRLPRAGIGCPEFLAAGEDGRGRAFLLVREVTGSVDLRTNLRDDLATKPERRAFARRLGETLAKLHNAGFDHPDLYAKHILVGTGDGAIHFLDWQRSRHQSRLSWKHRGRDLAALDATLPEELADARDRLACLRSYLRHSHQPLLPVLTVIRHRSRILLKRRRIREMRHGQGPDGRQNLVWLDGEALCVTPEFLDSLQGRIPDWLASVYDLGGQGNGVAQQTVTLPEGCQANLIRRRASRLFTWLWSCLRCRPWVTPEVKNAGLLFLLERHGLPTPRLLAFGQRRPKPWRTESFLLTQTPAEKDLTLAPGPRTNHENCLLL